MAADPQLRYSNEVKRADQDIYDDFKLKKPFGLHDLYKNYVSALRDKRGGHMLSWPTNLKGHTQVYNHEKIGDFILAY